MHKDKPPGLFDFASHSAKHAIWVGLGTGFVLSFLVHATLVVARAEPAGSRHRMQPPPGIPAAPDKDSAAAAAALPTPPGPGLKLR